MEEFKPFLPPRNIKITLGRGAKAEITREGVVITPAVFANEVHLNIATYKWLLYIHAPTYGTK